MASSGVGSIHKIEGKLNATGYQEILADKMLPDAYILIGEDFILQQDNAPIHTAFSTRKWLRTNDVTVLEWPSRSPDANPIKHLWHWLKVKVNRLQPRTAADLWAAVQTAWASILVDFVQNLRPVHTGNWIAIRSRSNRNAVHTCNSIAIGSRSIRSTSRGGFDREVDSIAIRSRSVESN